MSESFPKRIRIIEATSAPLANSVRSGGDPFGSRVTVDTGMVTQAWVEGYVTERLRALGITAKCEGDTLTVELTGTTG